MKKFSILFLLILCAFHMSAQRMMETLTRGLVAVKTSSGIFTSWRILGTEYYDTEYNLYRDGQLVNDEPLQVSNYLDADGDETSTYTVSAIVRGVEQKPCAEVDVWSQQYLEIPMGVIYSRNGTDLSTDYILNDACAADLDGDGEMEVIVKRLYNNEDLFYATNDSAFSFFEAYKLDGTRLWQIDIGPNMISSGHVETNLVAYDWDQDGKAELIMRAADGAIIYTADGQAITVGSSTANYRNSITHSANMTYSVEGDEFLVYMEGATATPYFDPIEYPLKRLEVNETSLSSAWGDAYGHRANKFFFGAPYLDGRNPSIFLARGIYTRHKMIAYDVNPDTHALTVRWKWNCSDSSSEWYGQGYHNYGIADVDLDGRDEIVYGSMVIDDNGNGLSTTGLGHGDAQHCGDLDPYRKGLEIFACNEDAQGANYRDATTSQLYYWHSLGRDCGRCVAGNFTEDFPGCQGVSVGLNLLSLVTDSEVSSTVDVDQNFQIFWDGDLCSETINGYDTEGDCVVHKWGYSWSEIFRAYGTKMCNWTKNTPSLQADILGDWREEILVRSEDDQTLRVYTTVDVTPWRNYTLLHDMQYRQAIVWQMCGYNQPPHVSYFLGESDGITVAPPPIMTNERTEATTSITTDMNDQHVLLSDTEGGTVAISSGAQPYILTVNAFSHTQGYNDNDNIVTEQTEYVLNGSLSGQTRLVKQGEGILTMSGTQSHAGATDIWGGVFVFSGEITASPVTIHRHAEFDSDGSISKEITMEYGAILSIGGPETDAALNLSVDSLALGFGSIVEFDVYGSDCSADKITLAKGLLLSRDTRTNGPEYSAPVFRFVQHKADGNSTLTPGVYDIIETGLINGDLSKVKIEGLSGLKTSLEYSNGHIYLNVLETRDATTIYWNGTSSSTAWDLATTANFSNDGEEDVFVTGDVVIFDDAADVTNVTLKEDVEPASVQFVNEEKSYSLSGSYGIGGTATFTKTGAGTVRVNNTNPYTGKTILSGGTTRVASLGNSISANGSLGTYTTETGMFEISNGAVLYNTVDITNGTPITIGEGGGTIYADGAFDMEGTFLGGNILTKKGSGTLTMISGNSLKAVVIEGGAISCGDDTGVNFGDTLIFAGDATYYDFDNSYSYSTNANNFKVNDGVTAYMYLDSRCTYTGRLYGSGTLKVNVPYVRTALDGNWSAFEGTIEPINTSYTFSLDNSYGIPNATLNIPADVYVGNTAKTYRIGKVSGTGYLSGLTLTASSGSNTWEIGSLNEDFTFSACITGDGTAFTKVGTGKMTVKSTNPFTGACNISEGILCINDRSATDAMLGTGALTVADGASLCGLGVLGNSSVTVNSGGKLYPGTSESATTGSIDFSDHTVSISKGGTLIMNIATKSRCTSLTGVKSLTIRGTLQVNVKSSAELSDGLEFTLWEATKTTLNSNYTFVADSPGDGLEWDTSDLSSGILRVVASTDAIGKILADVETQCQVYNTGGALVGSFTCIGKDVVNTMRTKGYKPGVYTVRLNQNGTIDTKKIVID